MKKSSYIILLLLIFLLTTGFIYASDDKSYTIDNAFIDLTVNPNGILHINETYHYSFDGTFNGVYRDIPLKDGEIIENIEVNVEGAYSELKEIDENGKKRLKIYLYADEAHTQKIRNTDVGVHISYDMANVVTLYNDIASLQFKLWGEEWDVGVGQVNAFVHLPGNESNSYWLNPQDFNKSDDLKNSTIEAISKKIHRGYFWELQVLMPLSDFSNATFAKHVDSNGKAQIEKNVNDYINGRNTWNFTFLFLAVLSLLSPVGAVFIYLKYGREPEIDYDGVYERELPGNDPPAVINALFENKSDIGTANMKGFEATILDLIDRGIINLNVVDSDNTKDLHLIFTQKNENLSSHEKRTVSILSNFADGNDLNLSRLNSRLSNEANAKWFMRQLDSWTNDIKNDYLDDDKFSNYFNNKGSGLVRFLAVGGLIYGILIFILSLFSDLGNSFYTLLSGIFLIIFSIVLMVLPEDIFGQWTKEGRCIYMKWKNFKKFLNDNSLINEHPPESIVIWKKYLIYGTALGVADNVYRSMKLNVPNTSDDWNDNLFIYHYYGGYTMMHHSFITGASAANPSSDSSFGSVGGGSGGGGGGAF